MVTLLAIKFAVLPHTPSSCSVRSPFLAQPIRHSTFETTGVVTSVFVGERSDSLVVSVDPKPFIVPFVEFIPAVAMEVSVGEIAAVHTSILEQKGTLTMPLVGAEVPFIHVAVFIFVNTPTMSTIIDKITLVTIPVGSAQDALAVPEQKKPTS